MGFTKIENEDLNGIGVIGLPDQPGLSTAAMQAKFEETARSVVIPKHNNLIDELEDTTAAGYIGATAPTGRTGATVQAILDDMSAFDKIESGGTTFTATGSDTFKINAGSNVTITALTSPDKGIQISATGGGQSTGDMLMSDYDSDGSVKTAGGIKSYVTTAISGKADSADLATVATSGQYSDLTGTPSLATVATSGSYNDLTDTPTIPEDLSDLNDDSTHRTVTDTDKTTWSGKSTVAWNQSYNTGQKIATVTIDGTPTDVYAPTGGGGGGGGDVTSVNGQQGDVVLDIDDINDVTITSIDDQHVLVYNQNSSIWENEALKDVALTGSYNDLTNKPTIPTITDTYDGTSSNGMSGKAVKSAIDALDVSDSAQSGKYVSAVTETDGKISVTRADLPTITDTYDGTSSNGMSGKAVKSAIDALDVSDSAVSGQYVSAVSETDGKISVTRANLPTVTVEHSGTASTSGVRKETITLNNVAYDIDGSVYMEDTANSASFVFTNSTYILSTSAIDVYTDTWGDNPTSVVVDGSLHTCTVTFSAAASRTVRIYIK